MSEKNEMSAGLDSQVREVFKALPNGGGIVNAKFTQEGLIEWAIVRTVDNSIDIRLMNNGERIIIDVARRGFKVRLEREASVIWWSLLTKEGFLELCATPIKCYEATMKTVQALVEEENAVMKGVSEEERGE